MIKATSLFLACALLFLASSLKSRTAEGKEESLIEGFRLVEVASVSDAMEQLYGKRVHMSHEMRPLNPTKFAGAAVTVLLKKGENTEGSKALQGMLDTIDEAGPGTVYVMV